MLAIVQISVFEAVNAITGDYEPYLSPATAAPAAYKNLEATNDLGAWKEAIERPKARPVRKLKDPFK